MPLEQLPLPAGRLFDWRVTDVTLELLFQGLRTG